MVPWTFSIPCVEVNTHLNDENLVVYANHVHDNRQKQATFT